jgi:hypothetical protein
MMKSKNPLFCFYNRNEPIVVIQAKSKKQARVRVPLISSHVDIPNNCRVEVLQWRTVIRAPVFFEGHFLALEEAIAEAEFNPPFFPGNL